jgi:hypothetical protein
MMGNRLSVVLSALAVVLAGLVALQWHYGAVNTGPIAPYGGLEALPASLPAPVPLPPLASLTQTVQRPLFASSRRPAPAAPAVVQEPAPRPDSQPAPPPALELSAVVIEDGRRLALFNTATGRGALRALQGEAVEGWELTEVRADGVTLTRDGQRHDIALRTFVAPARAEVAAQRQPVAAPAQRQPVAAPVQRPGAAAPALRPGAAPAPRPRRPLRSTPRADRNRPPG